MAFIKEESLDGEPRVEVVIHEGIMEGGLARLVHEDQDEVGVMIERMGMVALGGPYLIMNAHQIQTTLVVLNKGLEREDDHIGDARLEESGNENLHGFSCSSSQNRYDILVVVQCGQDSKHLTLTSPSGCGEVENLLEFQQGILFCKEKLAIINTRK